jgi:hypothetical protein
LFVVGDEKIELPALGELGQLSLEDLTTKNDAHQRAELDAADALSTTGGFSFI